jgi:hypothetical protein
MKYSPRSPPASAIPPSYILSMSRIILFVRVRKNVGRVDLELASKKLNVIESYKLFGIKGTQIIAILPDISV